MKKELQTCPDCGTVNKPGYVCRNRSCPGRNLTRCYAALSASTETLCVENAALKEQVNRLALAANTFSKRTALFCLARAEYNANPTPENAALVSEASCAMSEADDVLTVEVNAARHINAA